MAGGIGTRFWPLSRKKNPKQYLKIVSEKSMIQMTVERLLSKIAMNDIYVVTSSDQAELVQRELPHLPLKNIIIEPFGRNTAPCIALSALYLSKSYPQDELMFVLPADHVVQDVDKFLNYLEIGVVAAEESNLVTFGIEPEYPATGYGYIEAAEKYSDTMFNVKQFKEKPDLETAKQFIKEGNFFWNSGMFLWRIDTILKSFEKYLPKISELLENISEKWVLNNTDITAEYEQMPKIPIDIGIMEQAKKRIVVPVNFGWSDVGGWKALYDISEKDESQNVFKTNCTELNSKGCLVISNKKVALIDVDDLVVVDSEDAILITKKDSSEKVKNIVSILEEKKEDKYL
jgi:mannose-1-phosphate guanylyltransferase